MHKNYLKTITSSLLLILLSLFISCETSFNSLTYKVMFVQDDGAITKKIDVEYGYKLKESDFPSLEVPETSIFDGWYNGNEKIEAGYKVESNLILTPKITDKAKVSNVIFNKDSGSFNYNKEHKIVLLCSTKGATIYYTLDNSIPTKDSLVYSKPIANITENITIKAFAEKEGMLSSDITTLNYDINTYSINYNNGGHTSDVAIPENKIGLKIDKLTEEDLPDLGILTDQTFIFTNWRDQYGNIVKVGDEITKDLKLTAVWMEYVPVNNVIISVPTREVDYNETFEVKLSTTTTDADIYYTLDGSDPTESSTRYDGNPLSFTMTEKPIHIKTRAYKTKMKPSVISSSDYTLKTYTISFDNGSYGNKPEEISNLKKGDTVSLKELPLLVVSKDNINYIVDYWKLDNQKVENNITINNNITLVAVWKDYNATLPVVMSEKTQYVDYGKPIQVSLSCSDSTAEIYYTLDGTEPTTSSTKYNDTSITIKVDENKNKIEIKARSYSSTKEPSIVTTETYTLKTYTISFDKNGYGTAPDAITGKKNTDQITVEDLVDSNNEYRFLGWYIDEQQVTFPYTVTKDVKMIAKWEYNQVKPVIFGINEDSLDYSDKVALMCATEGATIYYTTDGSTPTKENSTKYVNETPITVEPTNVDVPFVIKAIALKEGMFDSNVAGKSYKIKQYTVTFSNDKNLTNPEHITGFKKNDTVQNEKIPQSCFAGYNIIRWIDSEGNLFDSNYKITQNITLTAVLESIVYNINYVLNSDSTNIINYNPKTYTVEDEIILKTDIRSGWKAQWYDNESLTGSIIENIPKGSIGDKILYATWTDIAPSEVSNLEAIPNNGKVTLSWDNPIETDLIKVIITYETNKSIEINVTPNTKTTKEINSLTNGNSYTFIVKTVDKQGNESNGISITKKAGVYYDYTEIPRIVNMQTINGTTYDIVEFGDWPQTVYSGDINLLTPCNNINAWDNCYIDGIGNFYVKVTATPYGSNYSYSNGTKVESGKDYYFKFEPIQWRVLTENYSGKKLLLAEKALTNCPYFDCIDSGSTRTIGGETINNNNYKESEIRAFLNGKDFVNADNTTNTVYTNKGFLQKAFTTKAIAKIADTLVDNSAKSTTDAGNNLSKATECICQDTTDKIFLLSEKEVTTASYGFDAYDHYVGDKYGTTTSTRQREPTDYAKATGIRVNSTYNKSDWWLRSPDYAYSICYFARNVNNDGDSYSNNVDSTSNGVVPALSISF